jgi:CheY-like chemotaxis protein
MMQSSTEAFGSILVVDDEDSVRELLSELLSSEGYVVAQARNGNEALAAIDRERPSLMLLDLMMPGLDGFGVIQALRERGLWPALPVLLMSAGARVERVARDLNLRFCVQKPFDLEDVLRIVAEALAVNERDLPVA